MASSETSTVGGNSASSNGTTTSNTESLALSSTMQCSASSSVPPLHTLSYSVTMAKVIYDYTVYTDIRLTKCSAAFMDASSDDLYIHLFDVPGTVRACSGRECSVHFEAAEYTPSAVNCNEAASLSAYELGEYAPICSKQDPRRWEPCQCSYGDRRFETTCVCVDEETGNPLRDGEITVIDPVFYAHYSGWCEANCPNSYYGGSASLDMDTGSADESNLNYPLVHTLIVFALIALFCIIAAVVLMIVLLVKRLWKGDANGQEREYRPVVTMAAGAATDTDAPDDRSNNLSYDDPFAASSL